MRPLSVINDVFLAVLDMAQATNPYATIRIGALPADDGISAQIATGSPDTTFQTKGMVYDLGIILNGKHSNAQTVSDALNDIHKALTMAKEYPQTDTYQILNVITTTTPSYIDREEHQQYLYGSSLEVRFFYKKG